MKDFEQILLQAYSNQIIKIHADVVSKFENELLIECGSIIITADQLQQKSFYFSNISEALREKIEAYIEKYKNETVMLNRYFQ